MQRCPIDVVQDTAGNCIPDAAIYVYESGTSTPAAIYSDNGVTPILPTGQTTSNALGQITFYAADGRYDFKIVKTGYADTWYRDLLFDDPVSWVQSGQFVDVRNYGVVGDGVTDDTAALANAINSNPKRIVMVPASFNCLISTTITPTAVDVTLFAKGATFTQSGSMTAEMMFKPSAVNMTFWGGKFVGNGGGLKAIRSIAGTGADGLEVKECEFTGFGTAVFLDRTGHVKIRVNYFHSNTGIDLGILDFTDAADVTDVLVVGNRFEAHGATDISYLFVGTSSATHKYTDVRILNNRFIQTTATASSDVCCTVRRCNGGSFVGNYCQDGSMGISVDSSIDFTVSGNTVVGSKWYGIEVAGTAYGPSNDCSVTGNAIDLQGVGLYGVGVQGVSTASGCTVTGNSISDPLEYGIFVSEYWADVTITGNTLNLGATGGSAPRGIRVYGHSLTANVIHRVTITGNTLNGSTSFPYGVDLRSVNYATVGNNTFKGFQTGGVYIDGTVDTADYIDVSGNVFEDAGGPASEVTWAGTLGDHVIIGHNPGYRYTSCDAQMVVNANRNQIVAWGGNDPEGAITANVGSAYFGWGAYIKFKLTGTGNTGWQYVVLGESGTTANRPTTNLYVGRYYFDTTLGKPVFIKSLGPTVWVDGVGTVS